MQSWWEFKNIILYKKIKNIKDISIQEPRPVAKGKTFIGIRNISLNCCTSLYLVSESGLSVFLLKRMLIRTVCSDVMQRLSWCLWSETGTGGLMRPSLQRSYDSGELFRLQKGSSSFLQRVLSGVSLVLLWPVVKGVLSFDGERDHTQSDAVICNWLPAQRTLLAAILLYLFTLISPFSPGVSAGH